MKPVAGQSSRRCRSVRRTLAFWWIILGVSPCFGQGTIVHITFDGPPPIPGEEHGFREYYESGMAFIALPDNIGYRGFGRVNKYPYFPYAYNGTAYISFSPFGPIEVRSLNGMPFGLVSVDLAEEGAFEPVLPSTIRFVGYRWDGSVVTNQFTTDGLVWVGGVADFQTFYFGPEFSGGLTRVWIEQASWGGFALDNLYVSIIPEPCSGTILGLGAAVLLWSLRRRANRGLPRAPAGSPSRGF